MDKLEKVLGFILTEIAPIVIILFLTIPIITKYGVELFSVCFILMYGLFISRMDQCKIKKMLEEKGHETTRHEESE